MMTAVMSTAGDAEAAWSQSRTAFRGTAFAGPLLATSPGRGATIAVRDSFGGGAFLARRIFPDGSLGPRRTLARYASDGSGGPWIAADRAGGTLGVWFDNFGALRGRRMTPAGRLGPAVTIAPPELTGNYARDADVCVDGRGNATIAWHDVVAVDAYRGPDILSEKAHARQLRADGVLGPLIDLVADGFNALPVVACLPAGHARVFWTSNHLHIPPSIRMTTIGTDGAAGPASLVSAGAPPTAPFRYALAVDARGAVTLAWGSSAIVSRRVRADGTLDPVENLGAFWFTDEWAPDPPRELRIGVDRAGRATVLWQRGPSRDDTNAIDAHRTGIDALLTLYDAPYSTSPAVAVAPNGNATAAWVRWRAGGRGPYSIKARTIGERGGLGRVRTLAPHTRALLSAPAAISDGRGRVTVAWSDTLGSRDTASVVRVRRRVPRR